MGSSSPVILPLLPVALRWRRVVSLVALYSLAFPVGLTFAGAFSGNYENAWPGVLMFALFGLPCLFIFLRLRGKTAKAIKEGLALAIPMGCVQFVVAEVALKLARQESNVSWWIQGCLTLLVAAQPLMVAAAIRTYYSMPRERGDWRKLLGPGGYGLTLLLLVGATVPSFVQSPPSSRNQTSAAGRLHNIATGAASYADSFGGVYPENLGALGPPPAGQMPDCRASRMLGLLDLPPDPRKSGYTFEYKAGVLTEKTVGGCVGAKSYSLTARPVSFGKTGRLSFFVDESGTIRATREDRPATASDPPLSQFSQ